MSTTDKSFRIPTIEEFVLSEVVNGTIDYFGGKAGKVTYQKMRNGNSFERALFEYFEKELKSHSKGKLNPHIRESIRKLCKPYSVNPTGPDRPYLQTELYVHFSGKPFGGGVCPVNMRSTFSLPQETVVKVEKEVLPKLSNPERRDVEGIGKAMRKFIDNDLGFIRERYHW